VPALIRTREPAVARPGPPRAAAAAVILTAVSIALFAALSASGDRAIVAPIGPGGPFADLHHRLAPDLVAAACWLAAACGGLGLVAGLAAVRQGWRPRPGLVLAACAAAAVVFVSMCRITRNTAGSSFSATTPG
jgi:hypothetical protein